MAHLRSKMDLMHVPTPDAVIDRLRSILYIPDGAFCIDPCCGTGHALASLAPNGTNYGVELELERAQDARRVLDHTVISSMQEARVSNASFGLLLLNPPYDDSVDGRLEVVFLDRCSRYLCIGGMLILIIKRTLYPSVANMLRRHYDVVGHWRFPDPYYTGPELDYEQTVLIARRRAEPAVDRDAQEFWKRELQFDEDGNFHGEELPDDLPKERVFTGRKPTLFLSGALREEDVIELLRGSPVRRLPELPSPLGCGRPPVALKQGHIALTLAAGLVNGVYGSGPTLHIARGLVSRQTSKNMSLERDLDDNPVAVSTETDAFVIRVRALLPSGDIKEMVGGPPPEDGDDE